MAHDIDALIGAAVELADLARQTTLGADRFGLAHEIKADGSPVTAFDQAVERALRGRIDERFPDHGILGEEFGTVGLDREYLWVLDPIDGTKQFAAGLADFGSLIALCRNGDPIIGIIDLPHLDRRCLGVAGRPTTLNGEPVACRHGLQVNQCVMSSAGPDAYKSDAATAGFERLRGATAWNVYGGGCAGYASLVSGLVDICLDGNLDAFDFCALVPVVEGAGGVITDWQGRRPGLASGPLIIASGDRGVHDQVLRLLDGGEA